MGTNLIKKQIGFSQLLLDEIEVFATENELNFSDAVRLLIQNGLGLIPDEWIAKKPQENNINSIEARLERLEKENIWFKADETQSKISRLEFDTEELRKKISLLIGLFKRHLRKDEK